MGFWLMRPNKNVSKIPSPDDYRISPCRALTSKTAFTLVTLLNLLLSTGLFITLLAKNKIYISMDTSLFDMVPFGWVTFLIGVIHTVIALIAIKTMKPGFAQLLIPITVILVVFCLYDLFGSMSYELFLDSQKALNATNGEWKKQPEPYAEVIIKIRGVIGIIISLSAFLWSFNLLYSFYSYVRDIQLYKEQSSASVANYP
ncbi:unnamed protein product, partial [Mesorhabditis belari]|uniref:MARVEL domain-containing protein n=1 Tax=Mesorhabditis belari TaxID=2138241 RepID=A0AAF3EUZ4_9BILA